MVTTVISNVKRQSRASLVGKRNAGHRSAMSKLADRLAPCGPVLDPKAAERAYEAIAKRAGEAMGQVDAAWGSLAPVFAASPYLAGLARRDGKRLPRILGGDPGETLAAILAAAEAVAAEPDFETARRVLRELKADLHLLTAISDLGGVWDLDQVTGALTRFADAVLHAALAQAVRQEVSRGALTHVGDGSAGPAPGLFCVAMGKHGAFELNYSSDIDFSIFYAPEKLPVAEGHEPQAVAVRIANHLGRILQERTGDGYVFRIDLRLRPDPSSTPPAMPVDAAMDYYESVGQNWERAAHIKARIAAGDAAEGAAFLEGLQPFIWRRNLDFAAIADIHSIKRQIHTYKVDDRLTAKGADLKLGRGGIREIEFFVQTQQLILGGRQPDLRSPRTLDALQALAAAGHVTPEDAAWLTQAYKDLRALEHRAQMIADDQTHKLPESDVERKKVAALWGEGNLRVFDAAVGKMLKGVNLRYGRLFAGEEALSSRFGSLVFTGVEDDPETLATLKRMGFSSPERVAATIRGWHHGHIAATRTERGRELFTRLAPRLLDAANATGAPDQAFNRFSDFFSRLSSGVQIQSLFLAQPRLFELIVEVMAFAPRLAATMAKRPTALDALLDPTFFGPIETPAIAPWDPEDFEGAMDAARRLFRDQSFRIGVRVMSGTADARDIGRAFAELADLIIGGLAPAALAEVERIGGAFPGQVAVVALGKAGSREMTAKSDLDLMTLYVADDPRSMSALKDWSAEVFYARLTQRLTSALSAPTGEGTLYEVDLKLRPSGTKGPVAVSFAAFEHYYEREAETWELLALTRARVVWASSPDFKARAEGAIAAALRRPRAWKKTAADVIEMRQLMERERPGKGDWDLKLDPGGLVDIEFAAQFLQLAHAAADGPLRQNTGEALAALREAGLADAGALSRLEAAWRLEQDLSQLIKVALEDGADVEVEPKAFKALLAKAGGVTQFKSLKPKLAKAKAEARAAYEAVVKG
ncbi:glutamate-ammonia-ligase adenylyltransferase, putative [Caulobacter vibrioides CB15]|uniref:Bifunctional glutamine synthetase adenylyltransferase/adenylyl-removing enzyme n=2 Tax=Caulobacter vibrioides TaxID=155892 RepID=GLNE_CAUVC|nr:RecName: Full=Bifunctional glutamine synthetase adenylyltransferase/adenylyl-removing enzyme; AltName: Full=ATP:glutamine synthetase adenylyltransferase; AltName: Full=ATase; Includes: RecName: Full=Glutamine synthetase adenylyl-L-tyrosine phosphorylase; AltName: Full=Adenylyl removase; Short=AR; Short=AT-N; Includes: RecName: Full=Glutamine synthetase adenylyl transferase; AltName: Full=Adenylyl transferase; Short=AT; Short=AT-C [Caulobacter vibrioides CB15]AAK24717.1 glutamate-ammonia-ligase 